MGNSGSSKRKGSAKQRQAQEGDRVPSTVLKVRVLCSGADEKTCLGWKEITFNDLCKGKRILVFGVPGAFTPVCSCDHLPGYEEHYDEILSLGIDDVYCIAVNDAFVMRHWGIAQGLVEELEDSSNPLNPGNFKRVKLIPDGAAKFTKAMGLTCVWDETGGFGLRSWRYAAVFNDMVIEKIFLEVDGKVEDDSPAGPEPLLVSDAVSMIRYLKSVAGSSKVAKGASATEP